MQMPIIHRQSVLFALVFCLMGSFGMACVAARYFWTWSLFPEFPFRWSEALFPAATQEDTSDLEFLTFWVCGFIALVFVSVVIGAFKRARLETTGGTNV